MNKIVLLLACLSLIGPVVHADSYKELSHQYNLDYQDFLRTKILKLKKHEIVELMLKNHKVIRGTFQGYQKYDDGFWILPFGKRGLFADDAYDIREILDVKIIIVRAI